MGGWERLTWASWPKRLLQLLMKHLMMVSSLWTEQRWHHLWRLCLCWSSCCSSSTLLLAFSSACQKASLGSVERFLEPPARIQVTPQLLLLHCAAWREKELGRMGGCRCSWPGAPGQCQAEEWRGKLALETLIDLERGIS